jgi:hypothetical protein
MFNPTKLLKLKKSWEVFSGNHPKFPKFLDAVNRSALEEGTIIEINVTTTSGKNLSTNLKLTQTDTQLFQEMSDLFKSI